MGQLLEGPSAEPLSAETVQRIYRVHELGNVVDVVSLNAGFTNRIYCVNGHHILKICGSAANEPRFAREVFLYQLFQSALPVPRILVADSSRRLIARSYMVYERIEGKTLYAHWPGLGESARRRIIGELCAMQRTINTTPYGDMAEQFGVVLPVHWRDERLAGVQRALRRVEERGLLSPRMVQHCHGFIAQHQQALCPQVIGMTDWDMHFGNALASGEHIVGLLDLERTEIMSTDYALHLVRRYCRYPKLYASEEEERFVRDEDYAPVWGWFAEFYPELFAYDDLEARLDLYSLEYDLRLLVDWPAADDLRRRLDEDVRLSGPLG